MEWVAPGVGARLWRLHWEAVGRRGVGGVCVGMEAMREECARRGNGGGSPEENWAHTVGNGAEGWVGTGGVARATPGNGTRN